MTASIWLRDLAAYALQALVLVAAGALLARLFRFRASSATLIYWQALLGLCLVLPVCQRWKVDHPSAVASTHAEAASVIASPSAVPAQEAAEASRLDRWSSRWRAEWSAELTPERSIARWALLLVAAGIVIRALWLAAGFLGLARLRRRSAPAPEALAAGLDDAKRQVGVRAEFRTSDHAPAPITFGLRRPLILLPANIADMEPDTQRAIACHELLHVRRRDWPWCVAEELVRSVLWFHPAVGWLIGRIHLTREQVVDDAVIGLTADREQYVEALLAVAQAHIDARLVPAPLFLRKSLLKKRVAEILKEKTMTARRSILCLAVSAAALFVVLRTSTSLFPLRVHAQELSSAPIQVLQGGDNLTHRAVLVYPERAVEKRIGGDVALDVSIDEQGQVSDARVVSGPEELRRACLESVLEWRFRTPAPSSTEVTIHFQLPSNASADLGNNIKAKVGELVLPPFPAESDRVRYYKMAVPSGDPSVREIKSLAERIQSPDISDDEKAKDSERIAELKAQLDSNPETRVVDDELEVDAAKLRAAIADPNTPPEQAADMKKELAERLAELSQARDAENQIAYIVADRPKTISGRLTAIQSERVPQQALETLTPQLGVRLGDTVNGEIARHVSEVVHQQLGEQFRAVFHSTDDGGVELVIVGPPDGSR